MTQMGQMTQIPAHRICCCGHNIQIHTDYRNPVEKKGQHGHSLSKRGPKGAREPTPAWTGFYCFSRHITSRMVLIYDAQVCFGWLSFTDNKGEDVAKYIKEGYLQCKGRSGRNRLCSILGRSSSDFRKLKMFTNHIINLSQKRFKDSNPQSDEKIQWMRSQQRSFCLYGIWGPHSGTGKHSVSPT